MKLKKSTDFSEITDFNGFSKDSLLPFGVFISKTMDFKENGLFQENEQNEQISMKSKK